MNNIPFLFEKQVELTPEKIAIIFENSSITYDELNKRVNQCARFIQEQYYKTTHKHISADILVAVILERSIDMVVAMLAIMKVGAAYTPIDTTYPDERIAYYLSDTNTSLVITEEKHYNRIIEINTKENLLELNVIPLNSSDTIDTLQKCSSDNLNVKINDNDLAYVMYTSGTTGQPKGVMIEHKSIVSRLLHLTRTYNIDKTFNILSKTAYVFDPSCREIYLSLINGAKLVLLNDIERLSPNEIVRSIRNHEIHLILFVPTQLRYFFNSISDENIDVGRLDSVKYVFISGEALLNSDVNNVFRVFQNSSVINLFGMTECCMAQFEFLVPKNNTNLRSIPIGKPITDVTYYVLDESHNIVSEGELYIGGASISRGYLNKRKLTLERFINNPFQHQNEKLLGINGRLYKTGDLVRTSKDGTLEYLGRDDFQVKISGNRVECGEIESVIRSQSFIKDVAVLPYDDQKKTQLVAYIILNNRIKESDDQVIDLLEKNLSSQIPYFMIPKSFITINQLPFTINGKLDRSKLPSPKFGEKIDFIEPKTDFDIRLAKIWSEVLMKSKVGLKNNFFHLGGDSLTATILLNSINREWGVTLTLDNLFNQPRFSEFASIVHKKVQKDVNQKAGELEIHPRQKYIPLSSTQKRLWAIEKLLPKNSLYHIPIAICLSGKVDTLALEKAINMLIKRHDILRTAFTEEEGIGTGQTIILAELCKIELNSIYFSTQNDIDHFIQMEVIEPFDLSVAPLFRAKLLHLNNGQCVLNITFHHAITDGWSINVISQELSSFYNYFAFNKPLELPNLTYQYADFTLWQDKNWSVKADSELAYWENILCKIPKKIELPYDYSRPKLLTYKGNYLAKKISIDLCSQIRDFCKTQDITLFMMLLSTLGTLLCRYTNERVIPIGSVIANRIHPQMNSAVGFFANTIVLPIEMEVEKSFIELLKKIKMLTLESYKHQDTPFELLVKHLDVDRIFNQNPLFQVMFVMQNNQKNRWNFEGIDTEEINIKYPRARFDLNIDAEEMASGEIELSIEYSTDLFNCQTIERLLDHFELLLTAILQNPEENIKNLCFLTQQEEKLLNDWNDTFKGYPRGTLVSMFEEQVRKTPKNPALFFNGESLTYEELDRKSSCLARYILEKYPNLAQENSQTNTLIGICLERSFEMIIGILGVLKTGAAYVPIDPFLPVERLQFIINDIQNDLLLTQTQFITNLSILDLPLELIDLNKETYTNYEGTTCSIQINPDSLAYIIYTSGTTGVPKGVMITHAGVINRLQWMNEKYPLHDTDRVLQKTPYFFDVSVWELFWANQQGAAIVIAKPEGHRDPEYLYSCMKDENVSIIHFVPSMLKVFLSYIQNTKEYALSLRHIFSSGEALGIQESNLCNRLFPHASLHNLYGPTEASIDVLFYDCPNELTEVPIGMPISNMQVYILDHDLKLLPIGIPGELYLGGVGLARGYLNQEKLTEERFIDNPFEAGGKLYKTGDCVKRLSNGQIKYLGRNDFQVKIHGYRIECDEIEDVIKSYTHVHDAVVIARSDENEKRLVAYVVLEENANQEVDQFEIENILNKKLPSYMVPKVIIFLDEFPINKNGKLDREKLPKPDRLKYYNTYSEPTTEIEKELAEIWLKYLPVKCVGLDDNFFYMGGDSIIAIPIVAESQKIGIYFTLQQLLEFPTIRGILAASERKNFDSSLATSNWSLTSKAIKQKYHDVFEDIYPASQLQQALFLFSQKEQENYEIYLTSYIFQGIFDAKKLERALQLTIQKHPILRSCLNIDNFDEIMLCTYRTVNISIQYNGFTEDPQDFLKSEVKKPFNWTTPPLLRVNIHNLKNNQYHVTLSEPWLDGWSVSIVGTDFLKFYSQLLVDQYIDISSSSVSYREFVALEKKALNSEEQKNFWLKELKNRQPALNIFSQFSKDPVSFRCCFLVKNKEKLNSLAKSLNVQLKHVLLAVHMRIISLLNGNSTDVISGLLANGRPETADSEKTVGIFLNILPFHVQINQLTWVELIKYIYHKERELLPYRRYPYAEIIKIQDNINLFETIFNFTNFHHYKEMPQTESFNLLSESGGDQTYFPLTTIFSVEKNGELIVNLLANLNKSAFLFVEDIGKYYLNVLQLITDHPTEDCFSVNPLPITEQRTLLVDWNQTERTYPNDKTLPTLFEAQIEKTPDNVAIIFEGQSLSYRELNNKANQLARYLRSQYLTKLGVDLSPDTPIALCVERSLEMLIGVLGIMKAGGAYVPVDPNLPDSRITYMLSDSSSAFVLTQSQFTPLFSQKYNCVYLDESPYASEINENLSLPIQSSSLAYIIYTSGTTGKPKGTMVSHRNLVNVLLSLNNELSLNEEVQFLAATSMSFDIAGVEWYLPLMLGGKVILANRLEVKDSYLLSNLMQKEQPSIIQATPSRWHLILEQDWVIDRPVKILVGGEALNDLLAERLLMKSNEVWNVYGPTETTIWSSCCRLVEGESVSIGHPLANTQLYVLDTNLQLLPKNVIGELYISGSGVARGYLNQPDLTAERFIDNPFSEGQKLYKTGDLVRRNEEGQLIYIGRNDFQVKIRGHRIECGEIESILLSHQSIKDAVVVARDINNEKHLVAYIVARNREEEVDLQSELQEMLSQKLPGYMVPNVMLFLEQLPLNSSGKLDRAQLPEPSFEVQKETYIEPDTELGKQIAKIWADVLKVERIGLNDDFFKLGGSSLQVMRVITKIRQTCLLNVPLSMLFEKSLFSIFMKAIISVSSIENIYPSDYLIHARPENIPLSFSQKRLWFLQELFPNSSVYNIPLALKLTGKLNIKALEKALNAIIQRHEILRTGIVKPETGDAKQLIFSECFLSLSIEKLTPQVNIDIIAQREAMKPFDLSKPPLLRASLVQDNDENNTLLLTIHHIVTDGWSLGVLSQDLSEYYNNFAYHKELTLPKLSWQYADFSVWHNHYIQRSQIKDQLFFWKERLSHAPEYLDLPYDFTRPNVLNYQGASLRKKLPIELSKNINKLVKNTGYTLNVILLSTFTILLNRYSNQEDIVVGTVIANRHYPEIENLIGFFANTLALKFSIDKNMTFMELLDQVYKLSSQAQDNQDLPFEKLVNSLSLDRVLNKNPLFQFMFVMQNNEQAKWDLKGLVVERLRFNYPVSKFDMTLEVLDRADGIYLSLEYSTELFKEETINRFMNHFECLLTSIVSCQKERIATLPMLSEEEVYQQLVMWNQTEKPYPQTTLHELFEQQVERTPDKVAVVFEDQQLTYRELNERANQVAHYLREQGIGSNPDMLVGIGLERSFEMLIGILAILKAGGAYVPLDPTHPDDRLTYMLVDTQIKFVLTQSHLVTRWERLASENTLFVTVALDTPKTYDSFSSENLANITQLRHLAYVIYTSGTTGNPKGVMLEHSNVVNYLYNVNEKFKDVQRIDFSSELTFDLSVTTTLYPLCFGKTVYPFSYSIRELNKFVEHLVEHNIELVKSTPALMSLLSLSMNGHYRLKYCIVGGEKLTDAHKEQILTYCDLILDEYGPTETTVGSTAFEINLSTLCLSIGKSYSNYHLYVLNNQFNFVPIGAVGELYIAGAGLARGYLNRPELTEEKFIWYRFNAESEPIRLYKTGDLVRYMPDGNLEYIGRKDHQVKIRGYRIECGEIELQLLKQDGVTSATVLVREENGNKQLVAYFVSSKPIDQDLKEQQAFIKNLRRKLLEHLPEYMVPAHFQCLESMPITVNGKVDRKALERIPIVFLDQDEYVPPSNELEQAIMQVWQSVLGIERIGVHAKFSELGGDSIQTLQVVLRLNQSGYLCTLKDVYRHQTIADLAICLSSKNSISAEQGILEGNFGLLPIQQWFFRQHFSKPNHWNQSFLVKVPPLSLMRLQESLRTLTEYHDVLRIRFHEQKEQRYVSSIHPPEMKVLDIQDRQASEIKDILTEWQDQFDIVDGPLFQVGYLTGYHDGSARLYFAFHHLIIDTVSWRIIIDDIKRLYSGQSLGLKSSSYRQWVNSVSLYKDQYPEEEQYWKSQLISESLPHSLSSSCYSSKVEFDVVLTKQLLEKTARAYHTEINDILLTALIYALSKPLGRSDVWICLEGHGRELIDEETDASRTVGWFTIQYPVCLNIQENISQSIQHIKETLRSIPRKGIGFSCFYPDAALPGITFNYLGQFDQSTSDWQIVRESSGRSVAVENIQPCYLTMNGAVIEGKLHFQLNSFTSQETVDVLGLSFKEHLTDIIAHCTLQEKTLYTVSDFNAVKITQKALNQLQSQDELIEAIYPANSLQRGFIFHALSQPEDDAYRVQFLFDYKGEMNIAFYQEAWRLTVQKFPILRTYFNWDNEVIQIVTRRSNLQFYYQDFRDVEDKEQALKAIQKDDRHQPFNLQQPALLRVYLIQRNEKEFTLLKSTHHSIEDGWSSQIILKTVHEYYVSLLKGNKPIIIEDFCYLSAQAYIAYHKISTQQLWRTRLESLDEANDINSLFTYKADMRKIKTVNDPRSMPIVIHGENYEHLKQISRSEGITLHEIFQFAWHKILQTYTQDQYTVVGTTVSGRSLPIVGIEASAGLYINTVPLVVDWQGEKSVLDQLLQIKENMQFINEHSYVDLSSLQKDGQRLFHSLLIFENYPVKKSSLEESELKIEFREAIEKVDYLLSLIIYESNQSITIRLNYDAMYLDAQKAERILFEFQRILEQLPEKLSQKHSEITLLSHQERYKQLIEWNKTDKIYTHTTIHQLFEEQVIRTPENIALVFENTTMTYKELNFRSNKIAHFLREKGIGRIPDIIVGIGVNRSFEMIIGILAILKAGGAYVPMDPDYPNDRLSYMIADTKIRLLLTQRSIFDRWQSIDSMAYVEVLCLDNISLFDSYSSENPAVITLPQHLAYILYTSGSTGNPKGVMLNHEGVVNRIEWMQAEYLLTSADSVLQKTPFIFDVSVWELFWANWYGARIIIAKPGGHKDPEYIEQLILEHNVTTMHFVPSMLSAFTSNLSSRRRFLHPSLRYVFCSGEALFFNQVQELLSLSQEKKVRVENLYGPTEASIDVTNYSCSEKSEILIGKPISNIQLYILGKNLELLPIGAVGELYIAGIGLGRGYLNQEKLTEERFIWHKFDTGSEPVRLYKTGDLVHYLSDGNLVYIGRADSQIKLRGFRVELGEIEAIIARQNHIAKVAVLVKGNAGNQYLVAFIETKQLDKTMMLAKYLLIKSLKKELVKYLPAHMLPSQIVVLNEISVGSTGKIDRKALANLSINNTENVQRVLPRTLLEEKLVNIWCQALQKEAIGIFDNFYSLGGNSITAVQLISLGVEQGITLTLAQLFEHPTIAELAVLVVEKAEIQICSSASPVEEQEITEESYYKLTSMQNLIAKEYGYNEANDTSYHLQMSYLLEDNTCSLDSFKEALKLMVAKHPVFRTAFRETEDSYEQFVRKELFFSVNEIDISYLSFDQQNQCIDEFLKADRLNLFHINNQNEIFFRFNIFKLNEKQFEFIFVAHHIIADGWGIILFLKELLSYYSLLKNSMELSISAIPNTHQYYVSHEIEVTKSEVHKKFWQNYFKDFCYNPPLFASTSSLDSPSTLCFKLNSDIYNFSVGLSQDLQVSLKSVFLSYYFDVIKDFFSNPERMLTVGVIVNGGRIPEISGSLSSLGLFWNMLPISLYNYPDKIKNIKQVHAHLTQVHSYSSYPLSKILENQGFENIFFSTYNFVQFDDIDNIPGELKIRQTRAYDKFHYPINFSVNVNTKNREVSCRIDYDKSKFNYEKISFLAERFQRNLFETCRSQFESLSVFSFFDKPSDSSSVRNAKEAEIYFDM